MVCEESIDQTFTLLNDRPNNWKQITTCIFVKEPVKSQAFQRWRNKENIWHKILGTQVPPLHLSKTAEDAPIRVNSNKEVTDICPHVV